MKRYCEKCRDFHDVNEMCPVYKEQLRKHPEWLGEAANLASISGQYYLITSQALDKGANIINKITGSNLSYEGTHQFARDIQVFSKLNSDSFRSSGQFANAQVAKETLENSTEGFKQYLRGRLNGTGQEVDWLRQQQGKLGNIFTKSSLPDGNTVGYDGITVNRFNGKVIERVTIKAAEGQSGLYTNAKDVIEAIEKGRLNPTDKVFGINGIEDQLEKHFEKAINQARESGNLELETTLKNAKDNLKVVQSGTTADVADSTERLTNKILKGQASPVATFDQVCSKMAQGAVIGAAVSLSVSSITNFIKYKNGELTKDEAFRNVGEESVKGAIIGAAMGGISIFLPAGAIGFIAGMAIGIYINAVCTNFLDEVFGKGAYEQILHASGYIAGTAKNVADMLTEFGDNVNAIDTNLRKAEKIRITTKQLLNEDNEYSQIINSWMEDK